ncbi:hypothetical protein GBP94_25615 [Mycobacterium avium subsp. hominissuis]|nr:hypothetical protein [Mycobacterium avium subsp. hominissuis]MBZ4527932.1 hypothetical protein [Mycobacterium avium subsp. hominissuis]MBZ4547398.1 hypothetical protein [Mycobacterium avium subsp. hominissuis]MBZ4556888.1 hypothetical protein [Mycobacterium avium subsp. hominissuis]MBZ4566494.1 hypothetical protein [Mycobacterium avium subsp. hominissuis]
MRCPAGLQAAGRRLWRSITAEFELENDPDKAEILAQACRVVDQIAELDEAAAEAPLTVRGSMGQPVISPFIAEARAQRALLAQLLARLNFEEAA